MKFGLGYITHMSRVGSIPAYGPNLR